MAVTELNNMINERLRHTTIIEVGKNDQIGFADALFNRLFDLGCDIGADVVLPQIAYAKKRFPGRAITPFRSLAGCCQRQSCCLRRET